MNKTSAICCLGSANTDYNFVVVEFPKEGETIQADKSFINNGGKVESLIVIYILCEREQIKL